MASLEKLFGQIFERKRWIVDQVKQQSDLYDQYLASICLINGIRPPSSLLSSTSAFFHGGGGTSADFKELKNEEIISGLLFPPPRLNHTSNVAHNKRPFYTENNVQDSEAMCTGTSASYKYTSMLVPNCHRNPDIVEAVPELSHATASPLPHAQTEERMPDTDFELDQSLERIQRSRSRQRALELRSSAAGKSEKMPTEENYTTALSVRITRSTTSRGHSTASRDLLERQNFSSEMNGGSCRGEQSRLPTPQLNCADGENVLHNAPNSQDASPSSTSAQKDILMGENTEELRSEEEITDELCGTIMMPQTSEFNCDQELSKPDKSEEVPTCRLSISGSTFSHGYSQLDTQLNMVGGHGILQALDTQTIALLDNYGNGLVHQQRCNVEVADNDSVSSLSVEACSRSLESNMVSSFGMVGLSVSNPLPDVDTFVEPKQLFFDEVEDCSLNGRFTPHSERDRRSRSSNNARSTPSNITSPKTGSTVDLELQERDHTLEVMDREEPRSPGVCEEAGLGVVEGGTEGHFNPALSSDNVIKLYGLSSQKGTFEMYGGGVADTSSGQDRIPKQGNRTSEIDIAGVADTSSRKINGTELGRASFDHFSGLKNGEERLLGSQLQSDLDRNLLNLDMDRSEDGLGETCIQDFDAGTVAVLSESSKLLSVSDGPGNSLSPDPGHVTHYTLCRTHKLPSGDQENEFVGMEDAGYKSVLTQITPESAQISSTRRKIPYLLRSFDKCHKNDAFSKSDESSLEIKPIKSEKTRNIVSENSWPPYKRRKLESQSSNISSTSSRLAMLESLYQIDEYCTSKFHIDVEDGLKTDKELKLFTSSSDVKAVHSNSIERLGSVFCSSAKRRKTERSGSSPMFESRSSNISSTSPRLAMLESLYQIDESCIPKFHIDIEDGLKTDKELKIFTSLSDVKDVHSNSVERLGSELCSSGKRRKTEISGSLPLLEAKECDQDIKGAEKNIAIIMGCNQTWLETSLDSSLKREECENAQDCLLGLTDISVTQLASEDHQNLSFPHNKLNHQIMRVMGSIEETLPDPEYFKREQLHSDCSVSSLNVEHLNLIAENESMPELEGFTIGMPAEQVLSLSGDRISIGNINLPTTTRERISVLEKLCRSSSMLTPFPESSKRKILRTPDLPQSLPNGLLERTSVKNALPLSDSVCVPSSGVHLDWVVGKPPRTPPPVMMFSQRFVSTPARQSLEKKQSLNPELTCFRIDEDTSTSEGNESSEETADMFHEGRSSRDSNSSSRRRPLVDMTNSKTVPLVSVTNDLHDRDSVGSVNTEPYMQRTEISAKQKLRDTYGSDRRAKKGKENDSSTRGNNTRKGSESLCNISPKLLRKASEGNKSQSFLDKGWKRANIVSNVSSFIPLVQQKQPPAPIAAGKRDVKVKALEAAEAAKRLEEKRENDRKLKKEAAKLERARLEEEKIKQVELNQKKKEEQKKKEADKAARKRLREENDKKDKERKRKCIEEARRQQRGQGKLRAEKEERLQRRRAADDRESKKKDLVNEEKKHQKLEKGSQIAECGKMMENGTKVAAEDAKKAGRNLYETNNSGFSFREGSGDMSYQISPYQVSDGEEEEEQDPIPIKKFIPTWAREKHLASILPPMQQIDPTKIFLPSRACSISQVLPRRNSK